MAVRRSGSLGVLAATPFVVLTAACAPAPNEPLASGEQVGSDAGSEEASEPSSDLGADLAEALAADPDTTPSDGDPDTGLSAGEPDTATDPEGDADRVAGTDSGPIPDLTEPDDELRARLIDFGGRYLAYDYRLGPDDRLAGLQPLVAADLLDELAQPVPAALTDQLAAEERVVVAAFDGLRPIDENVYELRYTVTTAGASADDGGRTLVVTVDEEQLVSDVR